MELVEDMKDILSHICVLSTLVIICSAEACPTGDSPVEELSLCTSTTMITKTISVVSAPSCTCALTLLPHTGLIAQTTVTCQNQAFVITDANTKSRDTLCDMGTCKQYDPVAVQSVYTLSYGSNSFDQSNTFRIWLEASSVFVLKCGIREKQELGPGIKMLAFSTTTDWTRSPTSSSTRHGTTLNAPISTTPYWSNSVTPRPDVVSTPPTTPPTTLPTTPPTTPKTSPADTSGQSADSATPRSNPAPAPAVVPPGGEDVTDGTPEVGETTQGGSAIDPSGIPPQSTSVREGYWMKMVKSSDFVIGVSVGVSGLIVLMVGTALISVHAYRKKMARLRKGSKRNILASDHSHDVTSAGAGAEVLSDIGPTGRSDYGSVFHLTEQGSNDYHFTY